MNRRLTSGARQLQESSSALRGVGGAVDGIEKLAPCSVFAHTTPHFTTVPASELRPTLIFTDRICPRISVFARIADSDLGEIWERFGSPRGPPGDPQETPRRPPGHQKPIYKMLSAV